MLPGTGWCALDHSADVLGHSILQHNFLIGWEFHGSVMFSIYMHASELGCLSLVADSSCTL